MLTNSLGSFIFYFNHFKLLDYGAFIWFIFLTFLFLILSIMLMQKYFFMGLLMLLLSFFILFVGPFTIKWYLSNTLRANESQIDLVKQLQFSNTLIIEGNITNLSKKKFSTCKIYFGFYPYSKNNYKHKINEFFPKVKKTFTINEPIHANKNVNFRAVFENFILRKDVNISIQSECYQ